jgi:NhaP-type Na+/H+ or K+/H+ antiporter
MTRSGKLEISRKSEETLHHIWQYLGYACETLVFLLAGVIITLKVWDEHSVIVWQDYFKCLALYFILHIIRASVIFAIRWPLSKLGYGLN